jgi:hypothetical protein
VDGAGNKLLARSGFTGDQNGDVRCRHSAEQFVDLLHRLTGADQGALTALLLLDGRLQPLDLVACAHQFLGLQQQGFKHVEIEGFGDVIIGTALHGLDGVFHRGFGGHDDDGQLGPLLPDVIEQLQTGAVGHLDVQQGQIVGLVLQPVKGSGGAIRQVNLQPVAAEGLGQHPAQTFLVVNHQYLL